eukprot:8483281-Pyramimonas_sp.AAC.1
MDLFGRIRQDSGSSGGERAAAFRRQRRPFAAAMGRARQFNVMLTNVRANAMTSFAPTCERSKRADVST